MKMKKLTGILVALCLLVWAGVSMAGSVWGDYDSASPLLVRYNGSAAATIQVTANTIVTTDDGITTTILLNSPNTLAGIVTDIASATNGAGVKNFESVYWAGIAADTLVTNYLIVAAATTVTKEWSRVLKWDTSNCLHYDAVASSMGPNVSIGGFNIDSINGSPTGTGNVTLSIYAGGSRKYMRVYESPVYVAGVASATNVASAEVFPVVEFDTGIYVGVGQVGFVRATRATTATTGGIGLTFK